MLTEQSKEVSVDQAGKDCVVTIRGISRVVKNCDALKLANTMFNKPGVPHYTEHEMWGFGLARK